MAMACKHARILISVLVLLQPMGVKADWTVLKREPCDDRAAAFVGDSVHMLMHRDHPGDEAESLDALKDWADSKFVVGKHALPSMNHATVGMCKGEVRRVHVSHDRHGNIDYTIKLLHVRPGGEKEDL
eukprot:TRINITY_DN6310_c0_g1_i1.p1 TRINITY_DN6310_c0_g1~~TRINITY_DN6310_c0_g1_i1.p1  ORF type:complete len:128 (-),score=29.61 TRINITY_DN6310_c0_g1_i1:130-513(-)